VASFLQRLFGGDERIAGEQPGSKTETVREIIRQLDGLEPTRARYLAAFSYVLARVANADLEISEVETREMERLVRELGELPEEQAILAVQIAKSQQLLFGGTEDYLVTRELNAIASREQKEQLLHCLFAVSAADDAIDQDEENEIRRISEELGFEHRELTAIRSNYNDKRTILRGLGNR
jgi:uncharacterized tellurite resistance protein B-like protein